MRRRSLALLWDARRAAALVRDFVSDRTLAEYRDSVMLRSAVERQFEIIGEALNQLSRIAPDEFQRLPDARRIVAFRNVLIHGYASVDDELVWVAATTRAQTLLVAIDQMLAGEVADSGGQQT